MAARRELRKRRRARAAAPVTGGGRAAWQRRAAALTCGAGASQSCGRCCGGRSGCWRTGEGRRGRAAGRACRRPRPARGGGGGRACACPAPLGLPEAAHHPGAPAAWPGPAALPAGGVRLRGHGGGSFPLYPGGRAAPCAWVGGGHSACAGPVLRGYGQENVCSSLRAQAGSAQGSGCAFQQEKNVLVTLSQRTPEAASAQHLTAFQKPNMKFIARLPDKGKKISDFAEKLKLAIFQEEELARTAELLSAVRLEFQVKQEEIDTSKQQVILNKDTPNCDNSSVFHENCNIEEVSETSSQRQEAECIEPDATNTTLENQRTKRKNDKDKTVMKDQSLFCDVVPKSATSSHLKNEQQVSKSSTEDGRETTGALDNSKDTLVDAFRNITIVDGDNSEKVLEEEQNVAKHKGNIFGNVHPKTPHYIEVLEARAKNPVIKKSKFKTHVLSGEQSGSSQGSSSSQSPGGSGFSITSEERRLRDKKHLNDITAARLPPLHHSPAKLLSVEESIAIQIQQKEAYEEMQAKLAAQKLAERLNIKMLRFEPEGEASMQYREVRDEDYFSAED
uniref:DNA-directed RNA polymerase II subunit GRINL1A n=1 Tax=Falco tinnunculus TaxID=100819 RepID=A0A8C4VAW3_FALTI